MKLLLATIALSILFNAAAFAQDPPKRNYTVDEINRALELKGMPPLQSSRVLHDDSQGTTKSKSTVTIRER